jgi:aspartyl-tRNA(Asn)/glutamyl-tRNA(Gln) amidotransferase subunit C
MRLSHDQIDHIAKLAKISLKDDERNEFAARLSSIFEWFAQLSEVDVDGVDDRFHAVELRNALRDDVVEGSDTRTRDALVGAFPDKDDDLLRVKAVF